MNKERTNMLGTIDECPPGHATSMTYVVRGRPGPADRPALPSGHPVSWGAITDGTVLDSAEYPFPVFLN